MKKILMNNHTCPVALVTGASSGIGKVTAKRLSESGYRVFATRRKGGASGGLAYEILALDVTSDDSVNSAVEEVIRREGRIDLLVNNAGINLSVGGAEESSVEQAKALFDTNFFGMVRMTRAVIPYMRQQGVGRIVNIGSVTGFMPMPFMALYSATKHALAGYSEALDHELRDVGIRVSVIEPAFMKTSIDANSQASDVPMTEYHAVRRAIDTRVKEMLAEAEDPLVVAEAVLIAARSAQPKRRYTAGTAARHLRWLHTLLPANWLDTALRKQLRLG